MRRLPKTQPAEKTDLEAFLHNGGFGAVWTEYPFYPERSWRADWYLPEQEPPTIIEYDGTMQRGHNHGHVSITGVLADQEKSNAAASLGLRLFRESAKSIDDGTFFQLLNRYLEHHP